MRVLGLYLSGLALLTLAVAAGRAQPPRAPADSAPTPQALDFFEKHVRPVLADNCHSCHGPKKQRGGLRLDSREAILKGGDSGPAVVLSNPDRSLLLRAVRHQGDLHMPPRGKLPGQVVETLAAWVRMGAPWPGASGARIEDKVDPLRWKTHWAFQPVRRPDLPAVKDRSWPSNPVDRFLLAVLEEKGLAPAPPADRRTLLRRVTFDLHGLPPAAREVDDFVADRSPDAWAKVVDRLLASPRYGERWGRHWLDVARYADTKGYVFQEERRYAYAYTYRDYVIRAFNDDKPFDRFIVEQLAADRLPLGTDRGPLAAMGFLTLGRRFLNNPHDIIDDRIDVVTRGLMGLTVSCARCHDHKYDPVPTADYYSLYGVFASSVEPRELPRIGDPEDSPEYRDFAKELQAREGKLAEYQRTKHAEALARFRSRAVDYWLAVRNAGRLPGEEHYQALGEGDLHPQMVQRWRAFLGQPTGRHHPVLAPWLALAALPQKEFAARAPAFIAEFAANGDPKKRINPAVARLFAGPAPQSLREVAQRYAGLLADVDRQWQQAGPGASRLPDADREEVRRLLYADDAPPNVPADEMRRFLDRATRDRLTALRRKVDQFKASSPVAPPRAMVLNDLPRPREPHVLVRGNPGNVGPRVPRQFPEVLAGSKRRPFTDGSGRLELARAIASRDNPLTARVLVNRVWMHHFGSGLVRTPSDFGLRSDPPTHPALLDWLAWRFMEDGWSVKKLHRLILLSSAYRQASDGSPEAARVDPENRLLARMNRRRLDFESLRDALLATSGSLDLRMAGPAVDITTAPFSGRRTVYGFIDRQNLPGLFRTFDFASPDATSSQRHQTTVPQQALFLMNSPFVQDQARSLVRQPEIAGATEPAEKVRRLYRRIFGRAAEPDEVELGRDFVRTAATTERLGPWERYAQVLLLSNEFAFVD